MAGVRRAVGFLAVLHQRHHRQSQGRAVQPPLHRAAHDGCGTARCTELLGARRDPARGAHVPCQRLGPALCGLHDGSQDGVPRWRLGRQVAVRVVRKRTGDAVGRRAHGVASALGPCGDPPTQVQHYAPHRDRWIGLPAGHDSRLQRAVRCGRDPCLGHDGNEPLGHRFHLQGPAPGPVAGRPLQHHVPAGARHLRCGHEGGGRRRPRDSLRHRQERRPAGARPLDPAAVLQGRGRRCAARWLVPHG